MCCAEGCAEADLEVDQREKDRESEGVVHDAGPEALLQRSRD